ncbi:RHS repeat-associated core domain-containing protein [Pseudomonas lini]
MPASRQTQGSTHPPVADIAFSRTLLLATDLQQSILAELDRSGPNRLAYTAYGSQISQRTAGTHLGLNGQLRERATGWYHLGNGHRVYNPVLMRFHSPDRLSPFGKGGVNTYAYAMGDPINYTDPTGEFVVPLFQATQRVLTVALHSIVPTAMIFGPKVSGAALTATRVSLLGSAGSAVGAVMQLAGNPIGIYVSTAGTAALVGGAITRGAIALQSAAKGIGLWKTLKGNVRNILGLPEIKKPIQTIDSEVKTVSSTVVSIADSSLSSTRSSPVDKSRDIRMPEGR